MNRRPGDEDPLGHRYEPDRDDDQDAERGLEDDRIIGTAFRVSLLVLAALAAGAALVVGVRALLDRPVAEVVEEPDLDVGALLAAGNDPSPPALAYRDVTEARGIDFVHLSGARGERLLPETMGGGVGVIDFDADGDFDLVFVDSGRWPFDEVPPGAEPGDTLALYRNLGDGHFERATAEAGLGGRHGYGMGIAVGDADGDGTDDLFLTTVGGNRLFANRGGRFRDVTAEAGVGGDENAWSTSAGFFDADADGDLDLMVLNYVAWSRDIDFEVDYRLTGIGRAYGPPTNFAGTQPYFYRNRGDGTFEEIAESAGLHVVNAATGAPVGKGLALVPADLDADGDLDVLVANDTVRNFAFLNQGDGTFVEAGTLLGIGYDRSGRATGAMGMDVARLDASTLAVAIGNFANEMSSLYVTRDGVSFSDEAIGRGIGAPSRAALTFGLFFYDYDLDGRLDFAQVNGHVEPEIRRVQASQAYLQAAQLFWNCGPDCRRTFVQVPEAGIGALATPMVGRGATYADFDGDGRLELVVTQIDGPPLLLAAPPPERAWLRVRLAGPPGNPNGIGARVALHAAGGVQQRTIMPTRSYLSQVEPVATFGLGDEAAIERIVVTWPDGRRDVVEAPEARREIVVARD